MRLEVEYGGQRATQVLAEPWSRDWEQWEELVKELVGLGVACGGADALEREEVLECVQRRLRAHMRLAVQNAAVVARSDEETLADLEALGYERRHGEVWGDSQCLADSLLQLLQACGVLSRDISDEERKEACAANRRHLNEHSDHALRPRRRCAFTSADLGEDPRAFLQHDVHEEPTVLFFLEWFAERGKRTGDLPAGGITLTVFSRFDSAIGGRSVERICERGALGAPGDVLPFDLYNLTGDGVSGYHYDPLLRRGDVVLLD